MNRTYGKVFKNEKGEVYGIIRETHPPYPSEFSNSNVLAEDECGNYFIEKAGKVIFWNHETNEQKVLSSSVNLFILNCETPQEVELETKQVESVWVDPEFAKKIGIKPKP